MVAYFENGGFDVVIGNPPYVQSHSITDSQKDYYYKNYKSAQYQINTYGIFLEKTFDLINPNAIYSLIIPNYWLSTKYDESLRKLTFLNYNVKQLVNTFEIFESATVDTLIIVGNKIKTSFPKESKILSISKKYNSIPERLNAIALNKWSFDSTEVFKNINDDVNISFERKITLRGTHNLSNFFNMYQGMKPYEKGKGNPKMTKEMMVQKVYHSTTKTDDSFLPLIGARNVKRYFCDWNNQFIKYGKNLAAPRKIEIFNGQRIVLNRIVSKEKIDGVFLDKTYINNTDVFNLIPKTNDLTLTKALLTIILSKLFASTLKKSNVNLSRNAFPKINVNTLEQIPLPELNKKDQITLEDYANNMLEYHNRVLQKKQRFIKRILSNLEIEKISQKLDAFYKYDFKTFLQELKKKKVKLSLVEQDEWEEYFTAYKTEINEIQQKINQVDREIDKMVYELYELTEEEIRIVEEG